MRDIKKRKLSTKEKNYMKRKFQIITSASAVSFLAFTVLAQETFNPKTDETASARQRMTQVRAERLNGAAKASDIVGMTVKNHLLIDL
jgi:hypothetical protein